MDRKQFKEAVIPVLYSLGEGVSAVKFITPRGTDYTEYVADKLYNAVEERLKIISSNPMLCDSLPADLVREIEIHIETTKECIENFGIPNYVKELLEQDIKMYEKILAQCKAGNVA